MMMLTPLQLTFLIQVLWYIAMRCLGTHVPLRLHRDLCDDGYFADVWGLLIGPHMLFGCT